MSDQLLVLLRGVGSPADLRRTSDALEKHTPAGFHVQVVGPREGIVNDADRLVWDQLQAAPEADLLLLQVGFAVGPGWHEQLRAAAYADAVIATASAVPAEAFGAGAMPGNGSTRPAGASSHGSALGEPLWGCVYVRRDALNVALAARAAAAEQEVATQTRLEDVLLVPGLVHVLAGTVVSGVDARSAHDTKELATPAVRRALASLEAEVEPLRVTVDLRCCAQQMSGTHVHALNLVASLARHADLRLSVLLPARLDGSAQPYVDALPPSVKRVRAGRAAAEPPQVFHRPYQLWSENEITDVLGQGTRLVLTHQDMILDRTPAYFRSKEDWRGFTAATALSFVAADEVAFFSEHARREAIRDGLVDPAKTSVVPPGTNHLDGGSGGETPPAKLPGNVAAEGKPFILVLCNSYFHKNRVFALRVAEELRRGHAWEGGLVFAGGSPPVGSSTSEEGAFVGGHPELRARFTDLGYVTDEEQRWLYRHATLILYPSLYEGFGLIPFEAAVAGTPCVYSSRSSVAEYLPAEGALLDVGDAIATARRLSEVLGDADAGYAIVDAIRRAGKDLTWDGAAASYAQIYRRSLERPVGLSLAAGGEVIVGARSQVAADEIERLLLVASRRVAPVKLSIRAALALASRLRRIARRR